MKIISESIENMIEIKNSKFITLLFNINDQTNINDILNEIKVSYPKATHYTYAYITKSLKKSSDDNEPSGTAGIPMLNVLEKEHIINILAVTVRYFGGIKLGAGGLVRAYSKSVKEALLKAKLIEVEIGLKVKLEFNYSDEKNINYLLKDFKIIDKKYLDKISYIVLIPKDYLSKLNIYNVEVISEEFISLQ